MSARAIVVFLAGIILLYVLLPRLRPAPDDRVAVREAEARINEAWARGEIGILNDTIGTDFSAVDAGGNRESRSDFLGHLRASPWKIESLRQKNLEIRFYGRMAVVSGADQVRERNAAGKDRSATYGFLHVFQKRNGRWLLISSLGSHPAVP